MNRTVTIVDYGVGNIFSVIRAFEACGAKVNLSANAADIKNAEHLVLPGVGAFKDAMAALKNSNTLDSILEFVQTERPFLGICVGLQLLMEVGEEFGHTSGLGLVEGRTVEIPSQAVDGELLKRPHIGWCKLQQINSWKNTVLSEVSAEDYFYFVHSFHALPVDRNNLLATADYGGHAISAVIRKNNLTGCQFHPERSSKAGLKVLNTFLSI